jgi:3-oxoacyl-[acyl-carrier-protein] synthase-1
VTRTELPPVAEILPHTGSMVLLSRVLHHDEGRTVCSVETGERTFLCDANGDVGAWVGLEYMAQCVAAHAGLVGRASGEPPRIGLLLGSRRIIFHTPRFHSKKTLLITAQQVWGRGVGLVSFDCSVQDGATSDLLVEGRLNCLATGEDGFGGFA